MGKKQKLTEEEQKEIENDPWSLVDPPMTGKPWHEKTFFERFYTVIVVLFKVGLVLGFLYLFICSLDFLGNAFKLLGGKRAGEAFQSNEILTNPIADLVMGVLATVLLQSSSTTTSIVVAMVAAEFLPVRPAIFIVMGANIGTSVTNTIVALGQSLDRNEFRRAFAGATVHDMFNWLSVLILLPIEWVTGEIGDGVWKDCGVLCVVTGQITKKLGRNKPGEETPELLKVITKPLTEKVIMVDKDAVKLIAQDKIDSDSPNATMVKQYCDTRRTVYTAVDVGNNTWSCMPEEVDGKKPCDFLFHPLSYDYGWSDEAVGAVVLVLALVILIVCLIAIVKLLNSLLKGQFAKIIKKFLNANLPSRFGRFITGYIAIAMGAGMTILVQSSSIFTSAMTPLVGVGVLHIKRMYPLTLGANIGTTVTSILAALATDEDKLDVTLQVALSHLFFNILGIMIWYPIPFMRKVPIKLAMMLGDTTAKYRWFAVVYLIFMFFIFPGVIFGLTYGGWLVLLCVAGPPFLLFIIVVIINILQHKAPRVLCPGLRNWDWLPKPLHSLEPYDRIFSRCFACCNNNDNGEDVEGNDSGHVLTAIEEKEKPNGFNGNVNGITNESYMGDNYEDQAHSYN